MTQRKISEMPTAEVRQSTYKLDDLIGKLSAINTEGSGVYNDFAEALLCLATEIRDIEVYLKNTNVNNSFFCSYPKKMGECANPIDDDCEGCSWLVEK